MASSAVALHPKGTGLHGEVDRVPADLDNATAVKATVTTEDVKSEAEAQTVKSRTISPFKAPGYIRYKVNSPTHEEVLGCIAAYFEWAHSDDAEGWTRLIPCLPPNPLIDYRSFLERRWNAMTAADFIAMVSSSTVLGDSTLSTGSFLGGTSWRRVSDTEIIGYHQPRLLHQRYADASRKEMRDEGRAHSMNNHRFRKVEGVWIFAGLAPDFRAGDGNRVKCMMDVFRELLEGNRRRRSEDRTSERDVRCYAACGRRRTAGQGGINGSVAGSSPVRA